MGLQPPNLDDRTYADLVDEARRLIPTYDPSWTNHNPSDPGITLIEMFAYLTELLLYRLNQVTNSNRLAFVELLNGPEWKRSQLLLFGEDWRNEVDIETATRQAVRSARARYRTVTPSDLEFFATTEFNAWLAAMVLAQPPLNEPHEWWSTTKLDPADPDGLPSRIPSIARAACIPGLDLARETEDERTLPEPGHISVIVIPSLATSANPGPVRAALRGYLDARRTLTMHIHVVEPCYVPVGCELLVASTPDADPSELTKRIQNAIGSFLDPLIGGADGSGWPLGRDVYVSELCQQLEAVVGVDYVVDMSLVSECSGDIARCTQARPLEHSEGDQIGLGLAKHHLPWARVTTADSGRIVIAKNASFIHVLVEIEATASVLSSTSFKRDAKNKVRTFFHPLLGGPRPDSAVPQHFLTSDLQVAIFPPAELPGTVRMLADESVLLPGDVGIRCDPGTLVHWDVTFAVEG